MIGRLLLAGLALAALGALIYLQPLSRNAAGSAPGQQGPAVVAGSTATNADLIETAADGRPLYRLHAELIAQPHPDGRILVTQPRLDYAPQGGGQWVLTARRGVLPADGSSADLSGAVHAEGRPRGSASMLRFDTEQLHVDMRHQVATTTMPVRVDWSGNRVTARGMQADLRSGSVQLLSQVQGVAAP